MEEDQSVAGNSQIIEFNLDNLAHLADYLNTRSVKRRKVATHSKERAKAIVDDVEQTIGGDDWKYVCLAERRFDFTVDSPINISEEDKCQKFTINSNGSYELCLRSMKLGFDPINNLITVRSKQSTTSTHKFLFSFNLSESIGDISAEMYLLNLSSTKLSRNQMIVSMILNMILNPESNQIQLDLSYSIYIKYDINKPCNPEIIDKICRLVNENFELCTTESIDLPKEPVSTHLFYSLLSLETSKIFDVNYHFHIPDLETNLLKFQTKTVNWLLNKENVEYDHKTSKCNRIPLINEDSFKMFELYLADDKSINLDLVDSCIYKILNQLCFGWDKAKKWDQVYFFNKYTGGIVTRLSVCHQLIHYYKEVQDNGEAYLPAQGLLAEEMGLGKTVEITALTLLNQRPTEEINETIHVEHGSSGKTIVKARTTLIIAPDSILKQWVLEVENLAPTLALTVYKGVGNYAKLGNNPALIAEYLRKFDMVFTTYSIISKELDYALFSSRNRETRNSVEKNNSYRDYLQGQDATPSASTDSSDAARDDDSTNDTILALSTEKSKHSSKRDGGKFGETDFEKALQEEINLAIKHNRIPEIYKKFNYESPLMLTHFWRVVLDEVQMVSSKYSRAFRSAALIPRFHAWGVSGTPIKKDLSDLNSILGFLKYFPFCGDLGKKSWQTALNSKDEFIKLWRKLAIRHTKAMVHDDIKLPPQNRILLTIPFTSIEQDNYDRAFEKCLSSICLDVNGNPATEDWEPSSSIMLQMGAWLQKLRQICNNPQIGQLSISSRKYKKSYLHLSINMIQKLNTLESLLEDMLAKALMDITDLERSTIQFFVDIGDFFEYIYMPKIALRYLLIGAKEAEKVIYRSNISLDKYLSKHNELSGKKKNHAFQGNDNDIVTIENELEFLDDKIRAMRMRIRNWNVYLHKFYFLIASGYFQCYDEEYTQIIEKKAVSILELELHADLINLNKLHGRTKTEVVADLIDLDFSKFNTLIEDFPKKENPETFKLLELTYYRLAENVRREILLGSIESVAIALKSRITSRLNIHQVDKPEFDFGYELQTKTSKYLFSNVPIINLDDLRGNTTAHLKSVVDRLFKLISDLNNQATVINTWMAELIQILSSPLLSPDEDPNGGEYEQSIKDQDRGLCYLNMLGQILIERTEAISGTESSTKQVKVDVEINEQEVNDVDFMKGLKKVMKSVRPKPGLSLLEILLEISYVKTDLDSNQVLPLNARIANLQIIDEFVRHLSVVFENQKRALVLLQKELKTNCNYVFNARIEFFKQLQQISDSVKTTEFFMDRNDLDKEKLKAKVLNLVYGYDAAEKKLDKAIGRYRYLKSLAVPKDDSNSKKDDDTLMCIICRSGITLGSLTQCGHKYCKDCLEQWLSNHRTCPMCKSSIMLSTVYNFTRNKPNLRANLMKEEVGKNNNLHSIYKSLPKDTIEQIQLVNLKESYSSKVDMIVKQVLYLRGQDPMVQIVVFSQWQDMLYILGTAFKAVDIAFLGSYGTLHSEVGGGRRHKLYDSIEEFKNPNSLITCYLLNAKAQSSGLTLVNATHVFLCEPLVNVSLELQAISRIHRIGQTKPTTVWMFAIENTVEESIILMSTNKRLQYIKELKDENESGDGTSDLTSENVIEKKLTEAESSTLMNSGGIDTMVSKSAMQGEAVLNSDLWAAFFSSRQKQNF